MLTAAGVETQSFFEKRELEAAWDSLSNELRLQFSASHQAKIAAQTSDNDVAGICRELGRLIASHELPGACFTGSVLLYEILSGRGQQPALKQGYVVLRYNGQDVATAWHVWVTVHGTVYDVGREALIAGGETGGLNHEIMALFKDVGYASVPLPQLHRIDAETPADRLTLSENEALWASLRTDSLEETFWSVTTQSVLALRDQVHQVNFGQRLKPKQPS